MLRQALLAVSLTAVAALAQETPATPFPPAVPLCARFPSGPVMIVDASGHAKLILKRTAADLAAVSFEALMSQYEIVTKTLPGGKTVTNMTSRKATPAETPPSAR